MRPERRKSKRLIPKSAAFAASRPEFRKIGRIIDIGRGGVAYEYLAEKDAGANPRDIEIDILLSDSDFYLSGIPCTSVYDIQTEEYENTAKNGMVTRRCGLKFELLKERQIEQLEFFLKTHVENG